MRVGNRFRRTGYRRRSYGFRRRSTRPIRSSVPVTVARMAPGTMDIVHRERLFIVEAGSTASGAATGWLIPIRPKLQHWKSAITGGSGSTEFSWGAPENGGDSWVTQMALLWQHYVPLAVSIEYISTCNENLNSTASPAVHMAVSYDVLAPVWSLPTGLSYVQGYTQAKASQSIVFPVNCDPRSWFVKKFATEDPVTSKIRKQPFNTESGDSDRKWDLRYNLVGFVYVMLNNYTSTAGTSIKFGEVWINYHFKFMNPTFPKLISGADPKRVDNSNRAYHRYATAGITTSAYFGTSAVFTEGGMGLTIGTATIKFAPLAVGHYKLEYIVIGDNTALGAPTLTLTNGADKEEFFVNDTSSQVNGAGTSTQLIVLLCFSVVGNGVDQPTITFSGGTLPANATSMDLTIVNTDGLMGLVDD